jgi:hypothetical protein
MRRPPGSRLSLVARRLAVLALTILLTAACSSAKQGHAGPRGPSSGRDALPSPALSQRFADGGRCPPDIAPELPSASGCVTSVTADLDGNGRLDRFVVFGHLVNGDPVSWWAEGLIGGASRPTPPFLLPVGLAVGGAATVYPRVAGAAEANGERGAEVFVQLSADLYHSGALPIDAIFDVRGGHVVPVRAGGRLFTFPTDGISRFGDGARCETVAGQPVFALTHVEILPNGWEWSIRSYRWKGLALVPDGAHSGRLPAISIGDPRVYRFYQLICGGLRFSTVTTSYPLP